MTFLLSYTQYLIKDINSLHIIQCKMQLVTVVFPFLFLNISHWNVAGVLCAVIYVSLTDLLVGKKKGDAIIGTEWTHWSKKSSFCHANWRAVGHRLDSVVSKGELEVEAFLSGFPSLSKNLCSSAYFLIVLVFQRSGGDSWQSFLLMSPVHQDSILITVSKVLNYN